MIELDIWRRLIEMDEMSLFLVGRLLFTNFLWREVAVIIASFTTCGEQLKSFGRHEEK